MKQQIVTKGIVLTRTNFGEADRILTVITPDYGKRRLMAKGVRKVKSKLAGGIELFSVSDITFLPGKGDIGTLVSTRMLNHYSHIVEDLNRTMLGYEILKRLNKVTEDATEPEYFELLLNTLQALDEGMDISLLEIWFDAQIQTLAGRQPNLSTDQNGNKLEAGKRYAFDSENMTFVPAGQGSFTTEHIKLLRLIFGLENPQKLGQINEVAKLLPLCKRILQ